MITIHQVDGVIKEKIVTKLNISYYFNLFY